MIVCQVCGGIKSNEIIQDDNTCDDCAEKIFNATKVREYKPKRCPERNGYNKQCTNTLNKKGFHKGPHRIAGQAQAFSEYPYPKDYGMSEGEWQAYGRYGY